ncbi:hypothetical protein FKG94_11510 [Exilibacterium tricleocarpae]|uniref:Restriction alleviation protein, Lar family n=1 Tax=Exilibacterium tricleocarpae TaxID=2591008 RepID=A0A545TQK0_9GAMM|nr:hypothetical protein FKG94_11510 [Exilibacterium tricleocarpae]
MAMQIEPCPFCQSRHLHFSSHLFSHSVTCESCKSNGPHRRLLKDAVEDWNYTARLSREGSGVAPAPVFQQPATDTGSLKGLKPVRPVAPAAAGATGPD